jgi:membrane-bound lytic murein transglycosylase D
MMPEHTPRAFVVIGLLAALVSSCAPKVAPLAPTPTAAPPPLIPALVKTEPVPSKAAPVLDPAADLIARAQAEFEAGRTEFDRGRLVAAREHFDRAVDMLLAHPGGVRSNALLLSAYDQLTERISALEVRALREADGVTESRTAPAAIDEVLNAALFERPAPKATTAETVAADLESLARDVPIPLNAKVLSYVELYQGQLRDFMQAGLDRAQLYLPMIQSVFREEGIPLDLAYIPLIESAFMPNALSRASARGMWQFMLATAQEHGLKQDWFLDERSDPEKATRAAAQYLKALASMFDGDWPFALASYNAGPGRMVKASTQSKSSDFWTIAGSTRYLPRETREYVPMILAAIIIGKNPEMYGFKVNTSLPRAYELVQIPGALDLKLIAEWANLTVEALQELNPELRRTTTPMTPHQLKVPIGTASMITARLATADSLYRRFTFHTIRKGDTMATIARKYGVSVVAIREANGLTASSRLSVRQTLAIPTPSTTALPAVATNRPASTTTTPASSSAANSTYYRVRQGDTLFSIAKQFSITVAQLKQWNKLSTDRINVGTQLRVRG